MIKRASTTATISNAFQNACSEKKGNIQPKKHLSPYSIRLTAEERAYLDRLAGSQPLSVYIRQKLLGEAKRKRRVLRRPKIDERQVGAVLASLGESRLPSNLNQLAKHANMGTLDVSRDLEQELEDACAAIIAMRDALLVALGQRPPQSSTRKS